MGERKKYLTAGLLAAVILTAADQLTKYLASVYLAGNSEISMIPGVLKLLYLENRGAAFGMLANRQRFFILVAVLMLLASVYVYLRAPRGAHYRLLRIVCILIVSGAAGNMLDRVFRGCVVDFLYISAIDFPVFNVADCYVCVGAALAVLALFTVYREDDFQFLLPKGRRGGKSQ